MVPLASIVAFLPSVITSPSLAERFWSLLGIVSLLTTAYIMRRTPLHPDRKGKRPLYAADERLAWIHGAMVPANGVVCLLLTAAYFLGRAVQPVIYLIPAGTSASYFIPRVGVIACAFVTRTNNTLQLC